MTEPRVTAIIAAYNAEAFLEEAIESVIRQSEPVDLLVVDDGSTDRTADIAERFRPETRVLRQPNRGQSSAINHGLEHTLSPFIAFLDADDYWAPAKLEHQLAVLRANPDAHLVFGRTVEFVSGQQSPEGRWQVRDTPQASPMLGSMLGRREAIEHVGKFSEGLRFGAFMEWYARARDAGLRDIMLDEVVLHRRVHGSNLTLHTKDNRGEYVDAVRSI